MTFLLRGTSAALVSWPVFLFAVVGSTQLSLLGVGRSATGHPAGLALAGAVGGVAAYLIVAAAWWALLRRLPPRPRVFPALVVLICGGIARGAAVQGVLLAMGYVEGATSTLTLRLATSAITGLMTFLVAAAGVQAVRDYRASTALLMMERQRLTVLLETSTEGIETRQADALEQVRARLDDSLREFAVDSAPSAVASLESLAGDIVRPLSHSLARDVPEWQSDAIRETHKSRLWEVWKDPVPSAAIRPIVVTAVILVMALPATFLAYSPRYGVPAVLTGALVVVVVLGLGRFSMLHWPPRSALRMWLRLSAVLLIAGAAAAWATSLMESADESAGVFARVGAIVIPVFGFLVAVISMMVARMKEVTSELTSVTQQLQWALARVQAQQWEQGGHLSRALHGPVQSLIHARLLALRNQAESGDVVPGALVSLREELQAALESAMAPPDAPRSLVNVLRDVEETWAGVARIECHIDEGTARALEGDPLCTHVLTDLLGEAVSNSIRHGGARRVSVEVTMASEDLVLARVVDDGAMSSDPLPGLGTTLLTRCTYDWMITSDGPTTLTARVPYVARQGTPDSSESGMRAGVTTSAEYVSPR